MSVEMACGSCQGRFLVTAAGTVACPHCGAHLIVSSADCPPSVDTSTLTTVEVDEPAAAATEPADPAAEMFAGYAGLADAARTETNESESAGVAASPVAEPAEDKSVDGNCGEEHSSHDKEQDIVQTHTAAGAAPAVDSTTENGEAASEGTVGAVVSSVSSGEAAAEAEATLPDVSAMQTGESDSVPAESPGEFPSFEFDADAPTMSLAEAGQLDEGLADDELPSAMYDEGVSPFDEGENNRDSLDAFPDFSDAADENDGNNLDALLAGARTEATVVENSLGLMTGLQQAQDNIVESVEAAAAATISPSNAADRGISRAWFLILASYASAMTIVCLWLLWQMWSGPSQLERLEDPADATNKDNKKIVQLFQVDMELPSSHVLRLGESRRFGNILVEPIKVTRGPLEFVRFSSEFLSEEEQDMEKQATAPTLKLWLRLENLSGDQTIAPLDSILLYTNRYYDDEIFRGNTFVCRAADKRKGGKLLYVYPLNTDDVWDLRGQHLEPLRPGRHRMTFIPTSLEGIDRLKGNLVWRVHFRKGFSRSERGVTTLIEINFHSDQIQTEKGKRKKGKGKSEEI